MQQSVAEKPKAVQPSPRVEQERERRRRRDDLGNGRLNPLSLAGQKDDAYTYRWVNDEPGRLYQLTQLDDWDPVTLDQLGETHARDKGVGSQIERVVDKQSGKRAVLLRKRKEYYLADKAKEQAGIDETEAVLKRGQTKSPEGLSAVAGAQGYVPAGGITIQSGYKP